MFHKNFKEKLAADLVSKKHNYYRNLFQRYEGKTDQLWHYINNIIGNKNKSTVKIKLNCSKEVTSSEEIANVFVNYFSNARTVNTKHQYNDAALNRQLNSMFIHHFN